jgi:putative transposase
VVGVDLGTNPHFLVTSVGEMVEAPRYYQKAQAKLARTQRALKGSYRYRKLKGQPARLHRKIANGRKDFTSRPGIWSTAMEPSFMKT